MKKILLTILFLCLTAPCFAMTKSELLKDLSDKGFIDSVGIPVLATQEVRFNNAKWYSVEVFVVKENIAKFKTIHFYVLNEGKEIESAYYKDFEPNE